MAFNRTILRKLAFIFVLLITLFLLHPKLTDEDQMEESLRILIPSLFVSDSSLFHPLLRQGTFQPVDDPKLTDLSAYLVVNAKTGEVYSAFNATRRVSPASLTKLMTAMVSLDVASPSSQLIASGRAATQEPTVLGVQVGEVFTLAELIPAMIATSANDAATIIGEEVLHRYNGNEQIFVALMNKKSDALGLGDTHFTNTQGFDDPGQYSNAYDLTRLAHFAYGNYPLIRKSAGTIYATIDKSPRHGFYHLPNWNALLGTYPGVDGLKIGYTEEAKHSTIVTATRDETQLIVVVIGAPSIIDRDLAAATLLNLGFDREQKPGVYVSESLIKPRIDEWNALRQKILKELENKIE
ncbi:MAG: hypothetical protein A3A65_01080 [Candidatus Chisholmbacteria bacterium RIFCSPLOWO2_01_FULL_49_14]|uniref:Peptidase S11 D-alanyl-D-alanine carboxypeptidase A N-terminal domain-containing protein n=1 Tax=Candidatus Chisholmbacteria bacterium RIFCSPLOWO2_01_FULL_49_14 TaxID=1797593 RepID=A0A1G1VZC1_9BACT|nr:MAG: hypothetical protein A3A65_01080 [Candidatus Chisholmbacteria bacterium RIFCSPLOWO2_01_FULL_49_14]